MKNAKITRKAKTTSVPASGKRRASKTASTSSKPKVKTKAKKARPLTDQEQHFLALERLAARGIDQRKGPAFSRIYRLERRQITNECDWLGPAAVRRLA